MYQTPCFLYIYFILSRERLNMNDIIWKSAKQEYLSSEGLKTEKIRNTTGANRMGN